MTPTAPPASSSEPQSPTKQPETARLSTPHALARLIPFARPVAGRLLLGGLSALVASLLALTIPLVPFLIAFLLGVSGLTWGDYTAWYLAGLAITCFTAALLYLRKRS